MRKAIVADTGPLYASVDPSDQYHRRAQVELEEIASKGYFLVISYATLSEAYTLVLRRLGTRCGRRWLSEVVEGTMLINPEPSDYLNACKLIEEFSDQAITLFDAVTATIGSRLRAPVWSYDRHFEILGVKLWTGAGGPRSRLQ